MKLTLITAILMIGLTKAYAQDGHTADVTMAKPEDIPQHQYERVRKNCYELFPQHYTIRASCETLEFESIRQLRGDKPRPPSRFLPEMPEKNPSIQ